MGNYTYPGEGNIHYCLIKAKILFASACRSRGPTLPYPIRLDCVIADVEFLSKLVLSIGVRVQLPAADLEGLRPDQRRVVTHQDARNHAGNVEEG